MKHRTILLLCLALITPTVGAVEVRFDVSYRSASTVYLGGGSADGLAVGDRLSVRAKTELIGEVEVMFLAEHSASCRIISEKRPIRAGDTGVLARAADYAAAAAPEVRVVEVAPKAEPRPDTLKPSPAAPGAIPWARTRGNLSFGLDRNWDRTDRHYDFEQRQARLDFSAWQIGGHPLRFNARARSRQDLRPQTLGFEDLARNERRDRLYEVSLRYEPDRGRAVIEAGRLGGGLLGLGYLDGVSAELRAFKSMRVGGFFGRRVELDRFPGFVSGNKYGGFARLFGGESWWPGNYDVSIFGAREFAGAAISREYVGAQSRLSGKSFVLSQWTEVDILRGWRKPADGKATQLSNLSIAASYRIVPSSSFGLSYDRRRNFRTAENRSVAEILFDTFARQGFRGSLDVSRAGGLGGQLSGGIRMKDAQSDNSYSLGGGLRHPGFSGARLSASIDGYFFTNGVTSGLQGSARLGRIRTSLMTDLTFGLASYTLKGGEGRRQNQWLRFSMHRTFGSGLWLHGEGQYDRGDDVKGPRGAFEIGYRF